MKLYPITGKQARFIWERSGAVYSMKLCVTRELPMPWTGEDWFNCPPALAEKRVINQFSSRDDYPKD